jgi:hypothetical protein
MFIAGNISNRWVTLLLPLCQSICPDNRPVFEPLRGCKAPLVTAPTVPDYSAILITDAAYAEVFGRLAQLHTLTGVPTQVVTVQAICGASGNGCQDGDPCNDTAKVIKDYLLRRSGSGLRHVVLGGDMTVVPSRRTTDFYANLLFGAVYQRTFYTDHYFAALSPWDGNGDCVYGDPAVDTPDYLPELAVTRIPVASAAELSDYIAKVERYLTDYDTTRIGTALFLSNVATQLSIAQATASVPIDSARYFETPGRTLSLVPGGFVVTRLYASLADRPEVSPISVAAEIAALAQGQNLVIHAGHGSAASLTVEYDGSNALSAATAYGLSNRQLPIMLSCACEAADFTGDVVAAGRSFVTAPDGGGIGYLGNSTLGLGIAGGMQLIDEVLKYAFAKPGALVGEAVMAAHVNLPRADSFVFSGLPVVGSLAVPVVDENAWRWTQKAATYLGDGLVPIYTNGELAPAPAFSVSVERLGNFVTIAFQPAAPVHGTLTVMVASDLYQLALAGTGQPVTLTVVGSPADLTYGFSSPTTLASYRYVKI